MPLVVESACPNPLHAEVLTHVRAHARRAIRSRAGDTLGHLALLFGLAREEAVELGLEAAAAAPNPVTAAADTLERAGRAKDGVLVLGHDEKVITLCKSWLKQRKREVAAFEQIIAFDLATLLALSLARDAADLKDRFAEGDPPEVPILITGPTGTGKELLARAIHELWVAADDRRTGKMFDALFVAGLPRDLINDELFGHVKGAFTGATGARDGRLKAADGSTLLIDEVGDLPADAQVRLLRFLDSGEFSRTGENALGHSRVRIVAATLKDLREEVAERRFRQDLFHRLCGVHLRLPGLKEREGAFDEVVPAMLERVRPDVRPQVSPVGTAALESYDWPGNLRELRHVLNLAVASAEGRTITLEDLPSHIRRGYQERPLSTRISEILSDETNDEPITIEAARARAASIQEHLDTLPAPDPEVELAGTLSFLKNIPDTGPDHQGVLHRLTSLVEAQQEHGRLTAIVQTWRTVDTEAVHRLGREAARERAVAAEVERAEKQVVLRSMFEAFDPAASPWWSLWEEVRALPILEGAGPEEMNGVFVFVARLLLTLPAAMKADVQQALRERRGIGGVLRALKEYIPDENGAPALPQPGDLSEDDWREIASRSSSISAAAKMTGYDRKTIKRYFEEYDLKPEGTNGRGDDAGA